MGYYSKDVYYNPEEFGLETVGEIEWSEPDYSFDLTAVWRKSRGEYYFASDSGCSCPAPFEDFTSVEQLEGPFTKSALKFRLMEMVNERANDGYGYGLANLTAQVNTILERLK